MKGDKNVSLHLTFKIFSKNHEAHLSKIYVFLKGSFLITSSICTTPWRKKKKGFLQYNSKEVTRQNLNPTFLVDETAEDSRKPVHCKFTVEPKLSLTWSCFCSKILPTTKHTFFTYLSCKWEKFKFDVCHRIVSIFQSGFSL